MASISKNSHLGASRTVAMNTIAMVLGKILTTILSIIATAVIARSLGVYGFGQFNTVIAYIGLFGVFADFGFFQLLVRELVRSTHGQAAIASSILILRSFFAVAVYAVAAGLAWFFPYVLEVKQAIGILAVAHLFLAINSSLLAIFQARLEMSKAVAGDTIGRAILLVGVLWAINRGWELPELFVFFLIGNLINLGISLGFAQRMLPLTGRVDVRLWAAFFRSSWPLGVSAIFTILYFKGDTVILSLLKTPVDVGVYGSAYKIFEVLITLPVIFMSNVFPLLTRTIATRAAPIERLVQTSFDILAVAGIGVSFGLIGLAHPIIELVVGPAFLTASTVSIGSLAIAAPQVMMILAIALVFIFGANLWSYLIIAQDGQRQLITPGIIATIINFSLNLLLIPWFSYLAAAVTTVLTEAYIFWAWGRLAGRTLAQPIKWGVAVRAFGAGAGMLGCLWLLRDLPMWLLIGLGAGVYLALLWLLGARQIFAMVGQAIRPRAATDSGTS